MPLSNIDWPVVKVRVRVEMRPPHVGERGWWVVANEPLAAAREVIRESEELGWVADMEPNALPDEEGMRAVTVVLEKLS